MAGTAGLGPLPRGGGTLRPTARKRRSKTNGSGGAVGAISVAERQALWRRMQLLGLSCPQLSALLGVTSNHLYDLFDGRYTTSRRLGFDRWPETLAAYLDRYEQALRLYQAHLAAAHAAITEADLPMPPSLSAWHQATTRLVHGLDAAAAVTRPAPVPPQEVSA